VSRPLLDIQRSVKGKPGELNGVHSKSLLPGCQREGAEGLMRQTIRFCDTRGSQDSSKACEDRVASNCGPHRRCRTVPSVVLNHTANDKIQRRLWLSGKGLCRLVLLGAWVFFASFEGHAQDLTAHIVVVSPQLPAKVKVSGDYPRGSSSWSFRNTFASVTGLGERIENLTLADDSGPISVRKIAPGEFVTTSPASHFAYEVSLTPPANPTDEAHVSMIRGQQGHLMPADLFPQLPASDTRVNFVLPRTWRIASSITATAQGWYDLSEVGSAVFFVGENLKEKQKRFGHHDLTLFTSGDWSFSRDSASELIAKIILDHSVHTGFDPKGKIVIMLAPFPENAGSQRWSAETRGSSVVLLMGNSASSKASLGQLGVVLCHELFHIWVPNAASLYGDYDWFFEGFTLYQALRCAVRLKLIDFQEYLATLGRVYESYLGARPSDSSLLAASRLRWTSGSSLVYDKGMLVAFLYDLRLRWASRSQKTLDDLYRALMRRFASGSMRAEGNDAVLSLLIELDGDEQFARSWLQTSRQIDLEEVLPGYGLRVFSSAAQKRLIADPQNLEQRALLEALGYRQRR
jgi:hypothetical protein